MGEKVNVHRKSQKDDQSKQQWQVMLKVLTHNVKKMILHFCDFLQENT